MRRRLVLETGPTYANFERGHCHQVLVCVDNCVRYLRTVHKFSNENQCGACSLTFGTCFCLKTHSKNLHFGSQAKSGEV